MEEVYFWILQISQFFWAWPSHMAYPLQVCAPAAFHFFIKAVSDGL